MLVELLQNFQQGSHAAKAQIGMVANGENRDLLNEAAVVIMVAHRMPATRLLLQRS